VSHAVQTITQVGAGIVQHSLKKAVAANTSDTVKISLDSIRSVESDGRKDHCAPEALADIMMDSEDEPESESEPES
jgi:hypothetical protein